jgi:hemoglobin
MSALDPAQQSTETIYDRLGGDAGLRRLVDVFYSSIFEDPVLQPVFGSPVATHVEDLTAFLGEVFGGPPRYSRELGGDRELRDAVLSCIEFGTEVAKVNSNARSDAELHPQREMPQWHW